jgi:hypothetical protein
MRYEFFALRNLGSAYFTGERSEHERLRRFSRSPVLALFEVAHSEHRWCANKIAQGNALGKMPHERQSPERAKHTALPKTVLPFQGNNSSNYIETQGVALGYIVCAPSVLKMRNFKKRKRQ